MTDEPTPEEIARVDAWRRAKQTADHEAYQTRKADIEQTEWRKLYDAIVGRRLTDVSGDQDHANWKNITLTFDDGTALTVEDVPYSDSREIDITVEAPGS
jgi:hypothetical protein